MNDLDGALGDLDRAIEIDGRRARFWHERAQVKRAKGEAAGADADFGRAIELEPQNAAHWFQRGRLRLDTLSNLDGAIADNT